VEGYTESRSRIELYFRFDVTPPSGRFLVVDTVKAVVAGSILVAIDGTGSGSFKDSPNYFIEFADGSDTVRTQSHVRNFYDDYDGVAAAIWDGPTVSGSGFFDQLVDQFQVASQMRSIESQVLSFIRVHWQANPDRRIDIIGHSRGGYVAMEVARALSLGAINEQIVDVRFLGLYDPVDMALGYGVAETVPSNVETAAVIYAAGTSEEISAASSIIIVDTVAVFDERRSRDIFNRADHGPESTNTDFDQIWIFATHSGIGGAPWEGDMPAGHTETNDRAKAVQSDQFIRNKAISEGVPINLVEDYGYGSLDPPEN